MRDVLDERVLEDTPCEHGYDRAVQERRIAGEHLPEKPHGPDFCQGHDDPEGQVQGAIQHE